MNNFIEFFQLNVIILVLGSLFNCFFNCVLVWCFVHFCTKIICKFNFIKTPVYSLSQKLKCIFDLQNICMPYNYFDLSKTKIGRNNKLIFKA